MKYLRLLLLLVITVSGCASSGGTALYRREIGMASGADLDALARRIIQQHHYEIFSEEEEPERRYVTHWRPRRPFADEQALGITDAESRLIVTGRMRGQSELGPAYVVHLVVENRVRVPGTTSDWTETTNTPDFKEYADEITTEFKRQLQAIGVRRY